jgi:hypothetical protein
MATSGTYIWNPDLAEMVDEAFERCRVDPALITSRHVLSARRSMRFMLADWATQSFHDFRVQRFSFTVTESTATYTDPDIPEHLIDILGAVLTRDGVDTPINFMGRAEFLNIPEKTTEGRPDRWYVDKARDGIIATFWPVPENSTDIITFDAVLKFEDHDTASEDADIPYYMFDAFAAGLASRLAEKYAPPELEEKLFAKARVAFRQGTSASKEQGDIRIVPGSGRRRRGSGRQYR